MSPQDSFMTVIKIRAELKERISFVCSHVCNEVYKGRRVLQLIPLACSSKPGDCFPSELHDICL